MKKGNPRRRQQEFLALVRQVERNKAAFIRRLESLVHPEPNPNFAPEDPCMRFLGAHTNDGYGRMNFTYQIQRGKKGARHIQIHAHRVFLILRLCRPIKLGFDAGHHPGCPHRDCVAHVFEQPTSLNCNTNGRHDSPPF